LDLLISDTSSILYEYLVTGNPIIIAKTTDDVDLQTMPESMDLCGVVYVYDGSNNSDIIDLVIININEQCDREKYQVLLNNCFYFNDEHSTDRTVEFILS